MRVFDVLFQLCHIILTGSQDLDLYRDDYGNENVIACFGLAAAPEHGLTKIYVTINGLEDSGTGQAEKAGCSDVVELTAFLYDGHLVLVDPKTSEQHGWKYPLLY